MKTEAMEVTLISLCYQVKKGEVRARARTQRARVKAKAKMANAPAPPHHGLDRAVLATEAPERPVTVKQ